MLKISSVALAALALLYIGFYLLPSARLANDILGSTHRCEAKIMTETQQRAEGTRPQQPQPDPCNEMLGKAKMAEALAK